MSSKFAARWFSRNRFYSPDTGRFISSDPLGMVDGPNTYGFCGGDPVNRSDPMGTKWFLTKEGINVWIPLEGETDDPSDDDFSELAKRMNVPADHQFKAGSHMVYNPEEGGYFGSGHYAWFRNQGEVDEYQKAYQNFNAINRQHRQRMTLANKGPEHSVRVAVESAGIYEHFDAPVEVTLYFDSAQDKNSFEGFIRANKGAANSLVAPLIEGNRSR